MKTDLPDELDDQAESSEDSEVTVDEASPSEEVMTVEQLQRELQEQSLRAQADLENYRKRVRRERENDLKYATMPLLRDLLAVADNLDRAIEVSQKTDEASGLFEGVELVAHQLADVLKKHHCERIEAEGEPFDPNFHEAVGQEPSDAYPEGVVMRMLQVGYQLYDRVVRSAQVFLSTGSDQKRDN